MRHGLGRFRFRTKNSWRPSLNSYSVSCISILEIWRSDFSFFFFLLIDSRFGTLTRVSFLCTLSFGGNTSSLFHRGNDRPYGSFHHMACQLNR
mmetsp:Transcript_2030/g.4275  ORF Transcript_2030/g.4275 Transcript_2030/m.4275 type:complete len:93 (+) Transcript_2030:979-1257(+)